MDHNDFLVIALKVDSGSRHLSVFPFSFSNPNVPSVVKPISTILISCKLIYTFRLLFSNFNGYVARILARKLKTSHSNHHNFGCQIVYTISL